MRIGIPICIVLSIFLLGFRLPPLARDSHTLLMAAPDTPLSTAIFPALFLFVIPLGFILLFSSAVEESKAPSAVTIAVIAWMSSIMAYFLVGFAFEFGGLAIINSASDYQSLNMEWSPFNRAFGTTWGAIGLRGFALNNCYWLERIAHLFVAQSALLGVASTIVVFNLPDRRKEILSIISGTLLGAFWYPIAGNWVWGGGWLANLGLNLGYGHGYIDIGGAGVVFMLSGAISLAAIMVFRYDFSSKYRSSEEEANDQKLDSIKEIGASNSDPAFQAMPSAYLPILGLLGAGLVMLGLMALGIGIHSPAQIAIPPGKFALNILLASAGGSLAAALYAAFTTARLNAWLLARGWVVGAMAVAAGAALLPPWVALACGLLAAFILPVLSYSMDQIFHLKNGFSVTCAMALVGGFIGILAIAFFADGSVGAGWNNAGLANYMGVEGQGITGLLPNDGFTPDFPGQFYGQLIGLAGIFSWGFLISYFIFQIFQLSTKKRGLDKALSRQSEMVIEGLTEDYEETSAANEDQTSLDSDQGIT